MRYRRQLRSRIILSFLAFGIGLTGLFAGITLVMREWLEEELIETTLSREVDNFVDFKRGNPDPNAPWEFSTQIVAHVFGRNKFANVPLEWRKLDTGVYELERIGEDGKPRAYKLAVRKDEDLWGFLEYDVTEQRRTRGVLMGALIAAVGAFAALSLLIAMWLSSRVLQPVTELVARVRGFERGVRPEPLAPHFGDDEVGQLAGALDDYARRLTELVERDREFNADVSHELRTPLAVIRGATELVLAQEGLAEKARDRIRRIDRAARQSAELIEALLILSRAERGQATAQPVDVGQLVDVVVDTHRPQLGSKPIQVEVDKRAELQLAAPTSVLAVALGNLIGNAFKYTQEGKVIVRVEADRVVVEDTGPGFEADEAGRLFERGYRAQGATGKGAGLGLAIVKRLCDLYRWRVALAPRDGGGAVATLEFT
jgi:signal transduction histidine kinase